MRAQEFILEGLNHPVIVCDVQPEYSGMNDGNENAVFPEIIDFVNKQTGNVLMLVNADDSGVSNDTIDSIKMYWEDTIREESGNYEDENLINWNRFEIIDKGYGYLRGWMDQGVDDAAIIKTIRLMYQQKESDSRELFDGEDSPEYIDNMASLGVPEEVLDDAISIGWLDISHLRKYNGAYLVGGGREECLREVELLMNAFNIKYKRIDSLVY